MLRSMQTPLPDGSFHSLHITRPSDVFNVQLSKRGCSLGLGIKKRSAQCIPIREVTSGGLVAAHNLTQLRAQRWQDIVLPEMAICAVNGIEGEVEKMMSALTTSEDVQLTIQRRYIPSATS